MAGVVRVAALGDLHCSRISQEQIAIWTAAIANKS